MNAIIYVRVSTKSQDYERQITHLEEIANKKGWNVRRTFTEKISGITNASKRTEFKKLLKYIDNNNNIDVIMVSEVSRLGRRVVDVLNTIDTIHKKKIAFYIEQFNMLSFENGKENPMVMMLLQMLSIGAEMENNLRKERQQQGIQIAKLKGVYTGRRNGAKESPEKFLAKHQDIVDMIQSKSFSLRRIAQITGKSINTVRKCKKIIEV